MHKKYNPVIFTINLNRECPVFNFLFGIYTEIEKREMNVLPYKDKLQLLQRIYRTGIIASTIYNYQYMPGQTDNIVIREYLASQIEAYFFMLRSLYDYLIRTIKQNGHSVPQSFTKFKKKYSNQEYSPIFETNQKTIKTIFNWYQEIRAIRNTIKDGTSNFEVYCVDKIFHIKGNWFDKESKKDFNVDMRLSQMVFNYSLLTGVIWKLLLKEFRNSNYSNRSKGKLASI